MEVVEDSIVANAPAAAAYAEWAQIENLPRFMEGVKAVQRIEEKRFAWQWEIAGNRKESIAEITLLIPNQRIAWRSISGAENSGVVSFEEVEPGKTKITFSLKYVPAASWDTAESLRARLRRNLENFKSLLETSPMEDIVEHNWQGF